MKIDITNEPPADIFRDRSKYIWVSSALLALVACGGGLIFYGIASDIPHNETLETVALALFAVPAMIFTYYGGKLQNYKRLSPDQEKELADLGRRHPEIGEYRAMLKRAGRAMVHAEYEACKDFDEDPSRNH